MKIDLPKFRSKIMERLEEDERFRLLVADALSKQADDVTNPLLPLAHILNWKASYELYRTMENIKALCAETNCCQQK